MRNLKLVFEYDGTRFWGYQRQREGRTVQAELELVLSMITDRPVTLAADGRTDTGVHALGQVASLRCRAHVRPAEVLRGLDQRLPQDLAVLSLESAPRGFHARHDALARAYRYQVALRRSAFGKRYTWWVPERLDLEAIRDAARRFVGRHDFRSFARRAPGGESTLVELETCDVVARGSIVLLRLVASHFLWNQVRRMVGTLVEVGLGHARPDHVSDWLAGTTTPSTVTAPAAGLFLEAVRYPWRP